MPPAVSVIIPAYNRASTIARSVESALAQTFQDLEIIVVDDGSSDTTCDVVQSIADERVRLVRHDANLGAAAARNTGMKVSQARYIAWLDSDDEWLPEKLQTQFEAFEHAAPDQRACYTAYKRIDQQVSQIYIPQPTDYKKLFLGCDQAPGSSLLFERMLLDNVGYLDTHLRRYEDWDWLLRYCSTFRLLAVDKPLVRVYFSSERSPKLIEFSAAKLVSKHSEDLRQFGIYRNIVISRRWMEVASYYALEHNFQKVAQYLIKGLWTWPFQPLTIWAWLINSWLGIKIGSSHIKRIFRRETQNDQ